MYFNMILTKLALVLIVQIVCLDNVVTSHRHDRESHKYHRSRTDWRRSSDSHRVQKTRVTMPSGNTHYISIPTTSKKWKCSQKKSKLVDLRPTGRMGKREYTIVKHEMAANWGWGNDFGGHQIVKIQKIVNSCLWNKYLFRRREIVKEANTANERFLFHGSKSVLDIVNNGFDERYANVGGSFGAGLYFASISSLSHAFTAVQPDGTRLILLCRVALGAIHIQRTVSHLAHAPQHYHSVKGVLPQPEYVIYRGEQAYPEYLITYK